MELHKLCTQLKDKVAAELQQSSGPPEKADILIAALYELSRSVLPVLGSPRKTQDYADRQSEVVDLITFIAIPLIRLTEQSGRIVAVLSEIAEGCQDPLLKKKLSVYAQELLVKAAPDPPKKGELDFPRIFFIIGVVALGAILVYSSWPALRSSGSSEAIEAAVAPDPPRVPAAANHASALTPSPATPPAESAAPREKRNEEARPPEKAAAEPKAPAPQELVTRIRVVNNQVLVPVTLKNGGESVRVELVLDTGATRTAIHETLAGRLRIDLKGARLSQSELADGRVVTSRLAKIDSAAVGPFAMSSPEVELIPYKGAEGFHDGLLGMDFLGKHRYQIDMEHEMVRWF